MIGPFKHSAVLRLPVGLQGMRVAGSGCVSPLDLDLGWAALVDSCVAEMAVQNNERVAGRGLLNNRVASFKQTPLHVPHGSALCSLGNTQVLSYTAVASAGRKDNDLLPSSNLTVVSSSLSSPKEQVQHVPWDPVWISDSLCRRHQHCLPNARSLRLRGACSHYFLRWSGGSFSGSLERCKL